MSLENLDITPISPHSDTLVITAFSTYYYRLFRMVKFDPNGMGDKAELEQTIERSTKVGKPAKDLKEVLSTETAAFKAYTPPLMSLISTFICNDIMHQEVPACAAYTTKVPGDGTTHLWSIDEKATLEKELDNSGILSVPGIEEMVSYIVGSSMELETPDTVQELPGSKMFFYIPFMTPADVRTALATLLANQHLFASYCGKLGIPTTKWNSASITKKRGPQMTKLQWESKAFQFWAFHCWLWGKNITADMYILDAANNQAQAVHTAADFLQYKHYCYKKGDKPNSYFNIVRMFYPEHADNNELGCSELVQASTLAGLDAIANADFNIICAAVNGNTLDWIVLSGAGGKGIENILPAFPGIMSDNTTLGLDKQTDGAPQSITIKESLLLPADFKLKTFGATTGFWDATNYNAEIMFFSRVFGQSIQAGGTKKGDKTPAYQKKFRTSRDKRGEYVPEE